MEGIDPKISAIITGHVPMGSSPQASLVYGYLALERTTFYRLCEPGAEDCMVILDEGLSSSSVKVYRRAAESDHWQQIITPGFLKGFGTTQSEALLRILGFFSDLVHGCIPPLEEYPDHPAVDIVFTHRDPEECHHQDCYADVPTEPPSERARRVNDEVIQNS